MTLSGQLQAASVQLELLTGPLSGIYDPNGMGAMFFAVLTAAAQIERNYIRDKTLEGQVTAAAKGNHGGRSAGAGRPRSADSAGGAWLAVRMWTTNGGSWTGRPTKWGSTVARCGSAPRPPSPGAWE